VYNLVYGEMMPRLAQAAYIAFTLDGWSRTQGGLHLLNMMACAYGFSFFVDVKTAGTEKVSRAARGPAVLPWPRGHLLFSCR
jgi:hypothetical protein